MTSYAGEAGDRSGFKIAGTLEVTSQSEALQRIKEMGFLPTRVAERSRARFAPVANSRPWWTLECRCCAACGF